ncbi:MAG: metallo-beta-lactamase family protein, partial [uncultured bacterium]
MLKKFLIIYISCLSCAGLGHFPVDAVQTNSIDPITSSPLATITVLNVHQGEATLIETINGLKILIDAGNYDDGAAALLDVLKQKNIYHLDYVFLTHFDLDHYGGLLHFGDEISISHLYDRGRDVFDQNYYYQLYEDFFDTKRKNIIEGTIFDLDTIQIKVIWVNGAPDSTEENDNGAVFLIECSRTRFLNMGDLPSKSHEDTVTNDIDNNIGILTGDIDLLHVGHHGSSYSTSTTLLELTKPEAAFISVGNNNRYGHPTQA